MIRSIVEILLRGTVIKRRLTRSFGRRPIFVSPDSALSYLKPDWAKASGPLLDAATSFVSVGARVWDIGGNVGVFTMAAAHVAGPTGEVVVLEPDPFLAALVQRTSHHVENTNLNITVICAAVSDVTAITRFMVAKRGRSSSSLEQVGHRSQAGGTRYVQYVPTITLDCLLTTFAPPDFVKIDVEGAEELVLKGASRLLGESRPLIYIEVGNEQSPYVTECLRRYGYRLYDGDARDGEEIFRCVFNTLAVPNESTLTNRGLPTSL